LWIPHFWGSIIGILALQDSISAPISQGTELFAVREVNHSSLTHDWRPTAQRTG